MRTLKNHKIRYLLLQCEKYKVPFSICYGIYRLETTYRKMYFRLCEDIVVILRIFLNLMIKYPIRNYTIGCCQIGLSSILYLSGFDTYEHLNYIKRISLKQAIIIIKAMYFKNNMVLLCKKIDCYYKKYRYLNRENDIQSAVKIGSWYNGKLIYGLQLQEIVDNFQNDKRANVLNN